MAQRPTPKEPAEKLDELTREAADAMTQALAAGLPKTFDLIDEALGHFLQDNQARADLLSKTAAGENPLKKILDDLIHEEAKVRAAAELSRQERERRESADDARIEYAAWLQAA